MNARIKDLEFKDQEFNQKITYMWVIGKVENASKSY